MKVVFVFSDNYPHDGACTSLLKKLFFEGGLQSSCQEIHILTTKHDYESADQEVIEGVTVHRCLVWSELSAKQAKEYLRTKPWVSIGIILSKVFNRLCGINKCQPFKKHVERKLFRKLTHMRKYTFDAIIPVCGCYAAGAAALHYAKKNACKLVVYQVDPCSTNAVYSTQSKKNRERLEQELYYNADAVITTPVVFLEMQQLLPAEVMRKVTVMEFPNISERYIEKKPNPSSEINCVFAGAIYAGARNPAYTVGLMRRIKNPAIKLRVFGADQEKLAMFLQGESMPSNVICHGSVSLERAQKEIAQADVLVNIGNIMTNQVPSKIFEYLSAGKPIVNVCVHEDCPSIPYLNRYPLALQIVENEDEIEKQARLLEAFILENAGKTVDKEWVLQEYQTCTAKYCAEQMCSVLKKL